MRNRAPIFALKESIALDYAAAQHTKWMNDANTDSHFQSDGSSPMSRVPAFGQLLVSRNQINENIVRWSDNKPADEFILFWIHDCGQKQRGHRTNVFSPDITHYGCFAQQSSAGYRGTCVGATKYGIKDALVSEAAKFGLKKEVNDLEYTGV